MKKFVIDCSVSASWCLKDEGNERAERVLDLLTEGEALVPSLWLIEMTNALVVAERKGRISDADATRSIELIQSLPIHVDPFGELNLHVIRMLAKEYGLTAYDACYLELAQRTGSAIATLDQSLLAAAKKCGIPVIIE